MRPPVRRATTDDATALRTLQGALTEPAPALLNAALAQVEMRGAVPTTTPDTLSVGAAFTLLVSTDDSGTAVGYLLALTGKRTHLAELVVDSAYRREGRATALVETLSKQQHHPITVHVGVNNTAARSFYRTIGFIEQSRNAERFDDAGGLTLRYPAED